MVVVILGGTLLAGCATKAPSEPAQAAPVGPTPEIEMTAEQDVSPEAAALAERTARYAELASAAMLNRTPPAPTLAMRPEPVGPVQRDQPTAEEPTPPAAETPIVQLPPPAQVDPLVALEKEFRERSDLAPRDLATMIDLELVRVLQNRPAPDPATLAQLAPDDAAVLSATIDAVAGVRMIAQTRPNALQADKVRPVVDAGNRLESSAELRVPNLVICSSVRAFGNYDPIESFSFNIAQPAPFVLYCEVEGFASEQAETRWLTRLTLALRLFNDKGVEVWSTQPQSIEDQSRVRRRDFFVNTRVQLPTGLPAGSYFLRATVQDLVAGRVAEKTTEIKGIATR